VTPSRAAHNKRPGRSSSQLCRPTTRRRIYARDGWQCVWCEAPAELTGDGKACGLTLDHLIPRAAGGSNRHWNLVTACLTCNSRRRDQPAAEYAQRFGYAAPVVALRVLTAVALPLPKLEVA
jgi:5-methylcytosine-specific restriction endonuclease McrA